MINTIIKYFCYPIHLIYYTTQNCDNLNKSRVRTILVAIPILLSFFVLPDFYWLIPFAYFYIASLIYKHEEPIEMNNEKDAEMNNNIFPERMTEFSSSIYKLSEPLENSVGWLSIEKNHPIYVFGIENELIVVTEYFGNEIGKIVLDAVNDVEQFVDVEYFKLRRNDKRKLACRFVPIGEDDYKIEYLRIMSDRIEVIGVDE